MALGGEASGASLAGFFGAPKIKQIRYNEELDAAQQEQATGLRGLGTSSADAVKKYAAAVEASNPQVNEITQDTINRLGKLASEYSYFDPVDTYERVRGGNISSLAEQFGNLATYGSAADKRALAALGYGGRGPGSYENILRTDRISRNIAPVLNTIYNNLGSDVSGLNQNRLSNLAATMEVLRNRQALPGSNDARALLPYQAEAGMLNDRIQSGGALAEGIKANTAGITQTKNKWANFFEQQGRAFDQVADTAISLYGSYMTGGLGGMGGMGGGGAGGGGSAPSPPPSPYSTWAPMGGGGGGGYAPAQFSQYVAPQAAPNYSFLYGGGGGGGYSAPAAVMPSAYAIPQAAPGYTFGYY